MNDMNDPNQTQPEPPPAPQPAGFCQNCGRPLDNETIRRVGTAVYCEPCLAARIGAPIPGGSTTAGSPGYGPGYGPVRTGVFTPGAAWTPGSLTPPGPNPGLAALLGFIPGVGAMYNEQYAKGIVHLVVFAVMVSLADNVNGIFGLFIAGWEFYMAIEAHHTARARRDGTPLPNPFGLNDIGERLGFGRAWPAGPSVADVANDAATAAAATAAGFRGANTQPPTQSAYQQPRPAEAWGAPADAYTPPPTYPDTQAGYPQPGYAQQFTQVGYQQTDQAYRDAGYAGAAPPFQPLPPYAAPYGPVTPVDAAAFAASRSRFPAGAIWLIGLGTIFLLTTTGIFNGFPPEALIGCVLFGVGVWLFLRRMMENGSTGFTPDGTPGYTLRLMSALRASVWVTMLGLLFLLDAFNVFPWRKGSWSLLIILAGVMAMLQRVASQAAAEAYLHPHPVPAAPEPADRSQGGN